jgi:RNA polymerase sigma factor (sigma-70 family)
MTVTSEAVHTDLRNLCSHDQAILRRRLGFILREPTDIDDVIQDAYVRIMEFEAGGGEIDNPPGFLYQICVNLALDRVRHLQRHERIFVSDNATDIGSMLENQPSREPTPEEHCSRDSMNSEVMSLLSDLPEKCGRAFVLKRFLDFNYREIASDINLSVSMIEKYVKRASVHLHERFSDRLESALAD